MNALVLFDSEYGQTEQIANEIAETLKEYGRARVLPICSARPAELAQVDLLVVGGPTHKHGMTPAVQQFLENVPPSTLLGKQVAVFDTRRHAPWLVSGSAAHDLARRLKGLGAVLVEPPKSFFLTGEEGPLDPAEPFRADHWAEVVVQKVVHLN